MNKKAVSPEMLVVLLVFVIGAMILTAYSITYASQLKEDSDIETCKLSVLAQSQTRKLPLVGSTPQTIIPLDCPRRILKIFEDRVELNGKKTKKYDFEKLSADEANRIIAEELRLCWYKMVEGNRDVFENSYLFGGENVCLICSEIEFDDKVKGEFLGLLDYLKSRKIPRSDLSYFDYLIRSQKNLYLLWGNAPWTQYTPWGYGSTQKFAEDKLNTNQRYSIYFLAYKPSWLYQFIRAYTSAYYIGLGKEDKLTDECSILVN